MSIAAHFDVFHEGLERPRAARRRLLLETSGALASGQEASVVVHNLSESGLLLESPVELESKESIDLVLPEAGSDRVTARVVWSSGRFYGCAFDAPLSPASLSAVQLRASAPASSAGPGVVAAIGQGSESSDSSESLGERLHRLRKLRGYTQGELAARLGVSKPTVWAWEQDRARPIEDRIVAIADALGVSEAELRPGRTIPGLSDLLSRVRSQVGAAFGVSGEKVRIIIDL